MAVNSRVLCIGLPQDLVEQLVSGLAPAQVLPCTVDQALEELDHGQYDLLLIDAKSGLDGLMLLQHVRTSPRLRGLPVIYIMDRRTEGSDAIAEFIRGLGIEPVAYSEDLDPVVRAAQLALQFEQVAPTPELPQAEDESPEQEEQVAGSPGAPEAQGTRPFLLIADPNERATDSLVVEAASRRLRTTVVTSLAQAREVLSRERPDAVLLDLALPTDGQDGGGIALLDDLHRRTPPVPALVLTSRDSFGDRAAVVTHGGRGFLQKPTPATEVLDAVVQMLEPVHPHAGKVMVVNGDPIILKGLEAVLGAARILTASIGAETYDLFTVWDEFERFVPDVLVLDLDAPSACGIDLCRIVRLDPRWGALPVVFLTQGRDADTVREVFAAGGDDYVSKGSMSPELEQKIAHWLQRAQWYRTMADVDPLTRLANRRGGRQVLERFLGTVRRHGGNMAVAVLDVDNFKQINDTIGHAEGDEVLRQVADRLRRTFQRDTDVIVRWGGEELLIGMLDTTKQGAARLLKNLLQELRDEPPGGEDRGPITFSAGVAQYPTDGADLYELYLAADRAMYVAKSLGKNRVVIAGEPPAADAEPEPEPEPEP
jgi:diguanylate cyclase (GGDEF)-like protein